MAASHSADRSGWHNFAVSRFWRCMSHWHDASQIRWRLVRPSVGAAIWLTRRVLRCCCYWRLLGCKVHNWSGFQRLYSRILLAAAAVRSATTYCNQWLQTLSVQFTLSTVGSCISSSYIHEASYLVRISIRKPKGPLSGTTSTLYRFGGNPRPIRHHRKSAAP